VINKVINYFVSTETIKYNLGSADSYFEGITMALKAMTAKAEKEVSGGEKVSCKNLLAS